MEAISLENWAHCGYSSEKLRAVISLTAVPEDCDKVLYSVTLTDLDDVEICQWDFPRLEGAVDFINEKYGGWDFYDTGAKSGSGCDTCHAH